MFTGTFRLCFCGVLVLAVSFPWTPDLDRSVFNKIETCFWIRKIIWLFIEFIHMLNDKSSSLNMSIYGGVIEINMNFRIQISACADH